MFWHLKAHKMDLLFFLLIVEGFCVFAWMSRKCLVLDEYSPYNRTMCPRSQLTANCKEVSDLALDISTVPSTIQVLCLWVSSGLKLYANKLSKFQDLQSLYIHGCLSDIDPEAFVGLTKLKILSIDSSRSCNASLPFKVFSDLKSLEDLTLNNFELPKMAMCDLYGQNQMKRLHVKGKINFTDFLCKVSCFSTTLESLSIEIEEADVLKPSNCLHGQSKFPALKDIRVLFRHIKKIEKNALQCLKNISFLSMPMTNVLQSQIVTSGVQQINHMDLHMTDVNIKDICELVRRLSVNKIYLHFHLFHDYSVSSWRQCAKLEEISLETKMTAMDLSFMSTLKNIKKCSVTCQGYEVDKTIAKGKFLDSLCKMNVSLPSLMYFRYRTEQNVTVSAKQFLCLSHLEHLELVVGNLDLKASAFGGLHNLQNLELSTFKTSANVTIESTAFNGLTRLHTFVADGCLHAIKPELFFGLGNVAEFTIRTCSIHSIQNFAFSNLTQLKYLKLDSHGLDGISEIQTNAFFGLQNLESLIIDQNLTHLESSCFAHLPSLKVLHLGYLRFSSPGYSGVQLLNLTSIFGGFPRWLSVLTLTSGIRPMTLAIADNSSPEVNLSLSVSGQKIVLWGCERPLLKSVTKLQISTSLFVCALNNTTPFHHLTSLVELRLAQWRGSAAQKLTSLNRLLKLKRLDLMNINFINLPDKELMFRNLTKLEQLKLVQCQVNSLEVDLIQDLTSLKYLSLDIPTEVSISAGFFEHLTSLKFTIIGRVQLRCTCDNAWFTHWAKTQQQVEVYFWPYLDKPLQCTSGGAPQDIERYGQATCSLDVGFLMFISTSSLLLFFMSTVLLHAIARDYLLAFYHIAHGWMNEALRGRNARRHYQYDAFVSYSGRDERWVVEKLLPNLEQRGPPFLRLCLHTRDFQLGKDIVENITDGLYRSRHTLCLVSRHFLRSTWCSLEMRLGTYRLLAEHRDVLILVFLEKIPSNLLSAHHKLARLVKTRTYIEWPQELAQQQAFWDRLWNKLVEGKVQ